MSDWDEGEEMPQDAGGEDDALLARIKAHVLASDGTAEPPTILEIAAALGATPKAVMSAVQLAPRSGVFLDGDEEDASACSVFVQTGKDSVGGPMNLKLKKGDLS